MKLKSGWGWTGKRGSWVALTERHQKSIGSRARLQWHWACMGLGEWGPCVCMEKEWRNQEVAVEGRRGSGRMRGACLCTD